jgi:quercetin dioxygenase-like cupin family protein
MEKECILDSNLDKLRSLTPNLPNFGDFVKSTMSNFVELSMERGNGFGWNLMNEEEIAVAKWFGSSGSVFPKHSHKEREYIIVYKGSMEILYDDRENKSLKEGGCVFHESNVPHSAIFIEDCWFLAITIPASKDWPK